MNEEKLMLVLKQLRTLENLQGEINKNFEKRLENLNEKVTSISSYIDQRLKALEKP